MHICAFATLRASALRGNATSVLKYPCHKPFTHQPQKALVRNPMLKESHHPGMIDRVEKCANVCVQHPPHLASLYSNRQSIQGVVLALALPESI